MVQVISRTTDPDGHIVYELSTAGDVQTLIDDAVADEVAARNTAITDALAASNVGRELGYAERVTAATTTNTTAGAVGGKISGLSITIVGEGRPVLCEFETFSTHHSVATTFVGHYILINDVFLKQSLRASSRTDFGPGNYVSRRQVLADGVSYTFEVGVYGAAAGTSSTGGVSASPMTLSVTGR